MKPTRKNYLLGGIAVVIAFTWFGFRFLTTNYTAFPENMHLPNGPKTFVVRSGWPLCAVSGEVASAGYVPGKIIAHKATYSQLNFLALIVDCGFLLCLTTSAYVFGRSMDALAAVGLGAFLFWSASVIIERGSYMSEIDGWQPVYWTTHELTPAFVILTCFMAPKILLKYIFRIKRTDTHDESK